MSVNSVWLLSLVVVCHATDEFISDESVGRPYVAQKEVEIVKAQLRGDDNGYGEDWVAMPDGNGTSRVAILRSDIFQSNPKLFSDFDLIKSSLQPPEDRIHFFLFTRKNPKEKVRISPEDVSTEDYDPSRPTKVVVHGWQSSSNDEIVTGIRDAYLEKSDVNVIAVDWFEGAANLLYPVSANYTSIVGKRIARLVDALVEERGARYKDFHFIGHSLGAHTSGAAGAATGGKVSRITGLDPALPYFENVAESEKRLDRSDADFVQIIHTCSGVLGVSAPSGHADFYPNGGTPFQPGCCCVTGLMDACSHSRSFKYYAESIAREGAFTGVKCSSWDDFLNNSCEEQQVQMGDETPSSTRGVFYLMTNTEYPFGLGEVGTNPSG